MIAGADGFRGAWIFALDDGSGRLRLAHHADAIAFAARPRVESLILDIPIGLPDRGPRECDIAARRLAGPRRASVFPAPTRTLLAAPSYAEANRMHRDREGKGISRQVFNIVPLVRAVDDAITPELQTVVREGHPELSFARLAGAPLTSAKHSRAGHAARLDLLRGVFPDIDDAIAVFARPAARTDILDACALLWTARRVIEGSAVVLPHSDPPRDARGLRMEIVV